MTSGRCKASADPSLQIDAFAARTDVSANGQPLNFTAGDTWAITYQLNDRTTGTYAATLRGFCVTVAGPS